MDNPTIVVVGSRAIAGFGPGFFPGCPARLAGRGSRIFSLK